MARILIGWQLGGGHGHVVNMLTVARALAARGHQVVLTVRDLVSVYALTRDSGFPVVQSPAAHSRDADHVAPGQRFAARSFADILAVHGYADPQILAAEGAGWSALLDLVRPDVVLAEFSPLLALACHGRVPCVAFGTGFCVPALDATGAFPAFEPTAAALPASRGLVDAVTGWLQQQQRPVPDNPLRALLGDDQVVFGFAEIDPYRAVRGGTPGGPLWELPATPPPLPATPACMVYLPAEHPGIRLLVESLADLRLPGVAYVRGAGAALNTALQRSGLDVSSSPLDLERVLPEVSVVLHHGGSGTTQRVMAAGRPQVMAPLVVEQGITSRLLVQQGVADLIADATAARQAGQRVNQVGRDAARGARAQALANSLCRQYRGTSGLASVLAAVERHAGR